MSSRRCVTQRRHHILTAVVFACLGAASGQTSPVVLDSVVAVVNNRAILNSDLTEATRLAVLEPRESINEKSTPQSALQRLISRTLIQQQIQHGDASMAVPTDATVDARVRELRAQLPACVRMNCSSESGWKSFLQANGITPDEVHEYTRMRLEILNFIEERFRQGIHIPQEEIEGYYRDSLLPQYARGGPIPKLEDVAPRIEEILLQQQVNSLFSAWLDNLRKQGDVEILDPSLEPPHTPIASSESQP